MNTSNLLSENNKVKTTFLFNSDPALWEINADIMKYVTENIPNQNIDKVLYDLLENLEGKKDMFVKSIF